MKTIKQRTDRSTQIAPSFCVCGCKRLVLQMEDDDQGGPIAVARCYKCNMEIEHASTIASLKRKLKLS